MPAMSEPGILPPAPTTNSCASCRPHQSIENQSFLQSSWSNQLHLEWTCTVQCVNVSLPHSYEIMQSCWNLEPTDRPTFTSLRSTLDDLVARTAITGGYLPIDDEGVCPWCRRHLSVHESKHDQGSGKADCSIPSLVKNFVCKRMPRPFSRIHWHTFLINLFLLIVFKFVRRVNFSDSNSQISLCHAVECATRLTGSFFVTARTLNDCIFRSSLRKICRGLCLAPVCTRFFSFGMSHLAFWNWLIQWKSLVTSVLSLVRTKIILLLTTSQRIRKNLVLQ